MHMIGFLIFLSTGFILHEDGDHISSFGAVIISPSNPKETIDYSELPICEPPPTFPLLTKQKGIIDILMNVSYHDMMIRIGFDYPLPKKLICTRQFDRSHIDQYQRIIQGNYYAQSFVEDIPFWFKFGYVNGSDTYIYTHTTYALTEYDGRVTNAEGIMSNPVLLIPNVDVNFTYSAKWKHAKLTKAQVSPVKHSTRLHFVMVITSAIFIITVSFIVYVVVTMKRQYKKTEEEKSDDIFCEAIDNDSSWISAVREVHKPPQGALLLAVLSGVGTLVIVSIIIMLVVSTKPVMYDLGHPIMMTYEASFFSSFLIATYLAVSISTSYGEADWLTVIVLMAVVVFVPVSLDILVSSVLSSISPASVPDMSKVMLIFAVASLFLVIPSMYVGGHLASEAPLFAPINTEQGSISMSRPIPAALKPTAVGLVLAVFSIAVSSFDGANIARGFLQCQFEYVFKSLLFVALADVAMIAAFAAWYSRQLIRSDVFLWQWPVFKVGVIPGCVFLFGCLGYIAYRSVSMSLCSVIFLIIWGILAGAAVMIAGGFVAYITAHFIMHSVFKEESSRTK